MWFPSVFAENTAAETCTVDWKHGNYSAWERRMTEMFTGQRSVKVKGHIKNGGGQKLQEKGKQLREKTWKSVEVNIQGLNLLNSKVHRSVFVHENLAVHISSIIFLLFAVHKALWNLALLWFIEFACTVVITIFFCFLSDKSIDILHTNMFGTQKDDNFINFAFSLAKFWVIASSCIHDCPKAYVSGRSWRRSCSLWWQSGWVLTIAN